MWVAAAAAAAMADGSRGESPPLHRHDRGAGGDRAKCCTMGDAGRPARAVGRPGAATEKQSTFCRCGGGGESRGEQEEGEEARTSSAMRALRARTPGGRGSVQKSPFVGAPVRQSGPQAICTPRTAFATSPPTQILCATEEEKTIRALFVAAVQSPDLSCTASTSGPTGSCVGLQLYSCRTTGSRRPTPSRSKRILLVDYVRSIPYLPAVPVGQGRRPGRIAAAATHGHFSTTRSTPLCRCRGHPRARERPRSPLRPPGVPPRHEMKTGGTPSNGS